MSNTKRIPLNETEKSLLQFSTGDLIPMLKKKKKLIHVKQMAFDYYDKDSKETFQVQVTVTRNKNDFLEPFLTEGMETFKK